MPHGALLCELQVPRPMVLRMWCTDLPNFYYSVRVSARRAETDVFYCGADLRALSDLEAVQSYVKRYEAEHGCTPERGSLALDSLAMGDVNATAFAHCAHERILEEAGARPAGTTLRYKGAIPRATVLTGLMIDDMAILAIGPEGATTPANQAAEELFQKATAQYRALGVPDVPEKRQVGVTQCTIGAPSPSARSTARVSAHRSRNAAHSVL